MRYAAKARAASEQESHVRPQELAVNVSPDVWGDVSPEDLWPDWDFATGEPWRQGSSRGSTAAPGCAAVDWEGFFPAPRWT